MLKLSFSPFPVLNTGRLTLRKMSVSDVQEVFEIRSDTEIMKFSTRPIAQTMQYALDHIRKANEAVDRNESINWAVTLKGQDKLIGMLGFVRIQPRNYRAEVGYVLHPHFQRQGIMQEALQAVLIYGFSTLELNSVMAVVDPQNLSSIKLLTKFGFEKEAYLKENIFFEGKFLDTMVYSLLRRNFPLQK